MKRWLLIAALGVSALGCRTVKPWERGTLAHRCMSRDTRPEESRARQHMLGARESGRGASGETGGGCGCN